MNEKGSFYLSPAYDLSYSYNPNGNWTKHHQMKINNKIDDITVDDLLSSAKKMLVDIKAAKKIIKDIVKVSKDFYLYSEKAKLPKKIADTIYSDFVFYDL